MHDIFIVGGAVSASEAVKYINDLRQAEARGNQP